MKRSPAWILALAPVAGLLMGAAQAVAQWAPSPYYPAAGYPVQPAYYAPPGGAPMGPAGHGGALAGYNAPMNIYDPAVMPAGFSGCPSCGGAGCPSCSGGPAAGLLQGCNGGAGCADCGGGVFGHGMHLGMGTPGGIGCNDGQGILGKHGPEGTAGCCNPRWWDVQAEFLYLTRDTVSRTVDFASEGVGGPIVLSTNDLDFDQAPGFRVMGAIMTGPGTHLEGGYFGTFNWETAAEVYSPNDNLYSAISDFGLIAIPNLPEVNQSNYQSINYSTELHNWELYFRRRWTSPNCRIHSSLLAGARYLMLDEDFIYFISAGDPVIGTTNYATKTRNDLIGFQTGGDLLVCLIPGVKLGGNLKAGIYSVRAENRTDITLTRPDPQLNQVFQEFAGGEDVAFVGDGGFECIIEATERVTLRFGYELLYINGVALAPENFNPDFRLTARDVDVNHNGDVFYHGFHTGFEYTW